MKIVIHNDETNEMLQIINRRHPDVDIFCCNKSADLPKLIKETQSEAIFSVHFSYETYPRTEIVTAESLRWISVGGVGTDHLGKWDAGRITVTNTAGAGAVSIAQYVFAGLLSSRLSCRALRMISNTSDGVRRPAYLPSMVKPC